MKQYTYLIIGGGMTAAAALEGIRAVDAAGSIGLISMETYPPYNRPPLSKQLWTGKKTIADIMRQLPDRVAMHLGRTAQTLDCPANRSPMIKARSIPMRNCCWRQVARPAGCCSGVTTFSTSARSLITTGCIRWRRSMTSLL